MFFLRGVPVWPRTLSKSTLGRNFQTLNVARSTRICSDVLSASSIGRDNARVQQSFVSSRQFSPGVHPSSYHLRSKTNRQLIIVHVFVSDIEGSNERFGKTSHYAPSRCQLFMKFKALTPSSASSVSRHLGFLDQSQTSRLC